MTGTKKITIYSSFFIALILSCPSSLAQQRLEMQGTAIIGNKELPKVLYIVPWKPSEPVALGTPSFSSVLDEPFQAVERSSFKRQVKFYNDIYTSADRKP